MAVTSDICVESDNLLKVTGVKNLSDGTYINDAIVTAHVVSTNIRQPVVGSIAVSKDGGLSTGFPLVGHGMNIGDKVLVFGTTDHDGLHTVVAGTTEDELVLDVAFGTGKTFVGHEEFYAGIPNATNIALTYIAASNGDYSGNLPYNAEMFNGQPYYLFYVITHITGKLVKRVQFTAKYQ